MYILTAVHLFPKLEYVSHVINCWFARVALLERSLSMSDCRGVVLDNPLLCLLSSNAAQCYCCDSTDRNVPGVPQVSKHLDSSGYPLWILYFLCCLVSSKVVASTVLTCVCCGSATVTGREVSLANWTVGGHVTHVQRVWICNKPKFNTSANPLHPYCVIWFIFVSTVCVFSHSGSALYIDVSAFSCHIVDPN